MQRVSQLDVVDSKTAQEDPENRFGVSWVCDKICLPLLILGCLVQLAGCRLCADCDLESYPSYGGAWQRTLRDSGRVGSIFDPGGSRAADLSERADSEAADAKLRSPSEDGDESPSDRDPSEAEDDLPKTGEDDKAPEDEEKELEEMEKRFKDLELQDIRHFDSPVVDESWQ